LLECLKEVLSILVDLTKPIQLGEYTVPGWYVSVEHQFLDSDRSRFPRGSFNLGLSHGVPGILSLLSSALIADVVVEGQKEAIESVATWLQNRRRQSNKGFFWESMISFEEEMTNYEKCVFEGKDAWCYGTPGVTTSLLLAGKALNNQKMKVFALESFYSVFQRGSSDWNLLGPTFCHGISGLFRIAQFMAQEAPSLDFHQHLDSLEQKILEYYHPDHPFGFQHYEPCFDGSIIGINRADLLEGSAGILLTLISRHHNTSFWDAPLLVRNKG